MRSGATRRCLRWAYEWVPGVDKFRRPVDANFLLVVALALHLRATCCADYVRAGLPRRRVAGEYRGRRRRCSRLLAWAIMFSAQHGHGMEALAAVLKARRAAIGAIAILAFARTPRARALLRRLWLR